MLNTSVYGSDVLNVVVPKGGNMGKRCPIVPVSQCFSVPLSQCPSSLGWTDKLTSGGTEKHTMWGGTEKCKRGDRETHFFLRNQWIINLLGFLLKISSIFQDYIICPIFQFDFQSFKISWFVFRFSRFIQSVSFIDLVSMFLLTRTTSK